jgi:hypothetical protein
MAIDKALNRAPLGLSSEDMEAMLGEPDIEIEIEDPEEVSIKMGGVEIEIEPAKKQTKTLMSIWQSTLMTASWLHLLKN